MVVLFWNAHTVGSLKIHWERVKFGTLAHLFLATKALSPPSPSLSPPLITVSVLSSASQLSSLHHGKELKIPHHKTSSPWHPPTHHHHRHTHTFIPSFYSFPHPYFSPHFLLSPLTSALLASTSAPCFFFSPTAIFLSIYPSRIAVSPSFSSLLLYWFTSQLLSSLTRPLSNRLSFCGAQPPLSLSVSRMKDKDL